MLQNNFLLFLRDRFCPGNNPLQMSLSKLLESCSKLSLDKKEEMVQVLLKQGKDLLLEENLMAFDMFEAASLLLPENPELWYEQGIVFLEYGSARKKEKAFILAIKNFKKTLELLPGSFNTLWKLASSLSYLGNLKNDSTTISEAKDKFQQALKQIKSQPKEVQAGFYFDFGQLWSFSSANSGEAIDVRMAIQCYRLSFAHQTKVSAEFWQEFGNAHFKLALLINDNRIYFKAIDYFQKALNLNDKLEECWLSLAHVNTELYTNTLDDQYFNKASESFDNVLKLNSKDPERWLEWAQLLNEAGKINRDAKKLKQAVEKSVAANVLDPKGPLILSQWAESLSLLGMLTGQVEFINEAEAKIVKALDLYPEIPELWYAYGVCMQAYGAYYDDIENEAQAIEKFQMGLSLDRTSAELWQALGNSHTKIGIILEDNSYLERAVKFYEKATNLKPSCPSLIFDYGKALLAIGELSGNGDALERSISHFEWLFQNNKTSLLNHADWMFHYARAFALLADIQEDESLYSKAIEILQNILLIEPDFPHLYYYLGLYTASIGETNAKNYQTAIRYFQTEIKQDPENDLAYLEWAIALIYYAEEEKWNENLLEEAEQKLFKAGELGNQNSYYYLACLYSIASRLNEAMHFLEKAKEFEVLPPLHELLEDEWLENIRTTPTFSQFISQLENQV